MKEIVSVTSPVGLIVLRPEREADWSFRFDLFCRSRPPEWSLVTLAPDLLDQLMRHQFQAQTVGYREQFPAARFDIIEFAGTPIGRIVVDRSATMVHIVDQAIVPELRGRGIGTAVMRSFMDEAAAHGLPVCLEVGDSNDPSLRLYLRLGFRPVEELPLYIRREWTPGAGADGLLKASGGAGSR